MATLGGLPPNVVDSTAWLAYFADEPSADLFAPLIEDLARLVVPAGPPGCDAA